jgi:hypothetical protein
MSEGGEELGFNKSMKSVIDALVCSWFDPPVFVTNLDDLGDFPGSVVADTEAVKEAFTMEVVDFSESGFIRGRAVRSMQVPHVDFVGLERNQRPFKSLSQVVGAVGCCDVGIEWGARRELRVYD